MVARHLLVAVIVGWTISGMLVFHPSSVSADEIEIEKAKGLIKAAEVLSSRSHYLEALDHLWEARLVLKQIREDNTQLYADLMFLTAETKIKGRRHQDFPASYVKSALKDIKIANRLRKRNPKILPQRLAKGYFLEGYIQKWFFMRNKKALECFRECVKVDSSHAACKRELSDLLVKRENE